MAKYLSAVPAWTGPGFYFCQVGSLRATNQSISPPKSDCSKSPPRIQPRLVAQFPPGFVPSFFFFPPPHATCHRFLYIFLMCVPAFGFEPLCEMLPQHLNLSWTATRADVGLLTTLNLCDTKPVLPARWLRTANHYMPFHYTFHYEMSNHPIPFFNQIVHFPVWMHGSFPSDFTHQKVNVYDNINAFVFQCLDLNTFTILVLWCGSSSDTSLSFLSSFTLHSVCPGTVVCPSCLGAKVGFLSGQWTSGIRWSGGLNVMFVQRHYVSPTHHCLFTPFHWGFISRSSANGLRQNRLCTQLSRVG